MQKSSSSNLEEKKTQSNPGGLISALRKIIDSKKPIESFSMRAFKALDTEMKGYLTKAEILDSIYYQGVSTHLALSELIHMVESKGVGHQFTYAEFDDLLTHFEFYKSVLSFDLVMHDF